jgi:hypothetical protein
MGTSRDYREGRQGKKNFIDELLTYSLKSLDCNEIPSFFLFIIFLLFLALSLSFWFGCPPQSLAFGTRKFLEGHTFSCDVNFFFLRLLAITFFLGQKIRWKVTM